MLDQGLSELVPVLHSRISQLFLPPWNQPSIARNLDTKVKSTREKLLKSKRKNRLSQREKNPLSQREKNRSLKSTRKNRFKRKNP